MEIARTSVSAYWRIFVVIIHIPKIGANDVILSLRHYNLVSLSGIYFTVYDRKGR